MRFAPAEAIMRWARAEEADTARPAAFKRSSGRRKEADTEPRKLFLTKNQCRSTMWAGSSENTMKGPNVSIVLRRRPRVSETAATAAIPPETSGYSVYRNNGPSPAIGSAPERLGQSGRHFL